MSSSTNIGEFSCHLSIVKGRIRRVEGVDTMGARTLKLSVVAKMSLPQRNVARFVGNVLLLCCQLVLNSFLWIDLIKTVQNENNVILIIGFKLHY